MPLPKKVEQEMSATIFYKDGYVNVYTVDDTAIDDIYSELWMEEDGSVLESIQAKTKREFVCKFMEEYQSKWQLSFIF